MSSFAVLLDNDVKATKSWFATQTFSKLCVAVGFAAVFGMISTGLFYGSGYFFHMLAPLFPYGMLTAEYVLRASVVIIFCLGLGSSIATTANIYFSPNRNFYYLMTLPVNTDEIISWMFWKTIAANTIFLAIFLLPLMFAYALTFLGGINLIFIVKAVCALAAISLLTVSLGGIIAGGMVSRFKNQSIITSVAGIIVFLIAMGGVIKLIFPPEMASLATITGDEFFKVYNSLPLTNLMIPTNWISMMVVENSLIPVVLTCSLVTIITVIFLEIQSRVFLKICKELSAKSIAPQYTGVGNQKTHLNFRFEKFGATAALALKDMASIIRSPTEAGYGIFLLALMFTFFFLFSFARISNEISTEWIHGLITSTYVGFIFFANTYLLRLVYPLMAKESDSAWYLFTQPISRMQILRSKLAGSFYVGLPVLILALIVWFIPAFAAPYRMVLALSSFVVVGLLITAHTLLGSIYPNFFEGSNPEKVSTSSMGIASLVVTSVATLVFAVSIYGYITQALPLSKVIAIHVFFPVFSLSLLFIVAKKSLKSYEF